MSHLTLSRWRCLLPAEETEEQALERIVRAKVRRDVRQACAWDEELSELEGDTQEMRLLELARFELLNPTEQVIYQNNGGLAEDEEPPAPVAAWTKGVFAIVMLCLIVFPMLYLLLFGVQQGKQKIKSWWIGTMTAFALDAGIYEPIQILFLHVYMPSLVRKRLKRLVDPTQTARFPFRTPLYEHPTTYLAAKHRGLIVARRMLRRRGSLQSGKSSRASITAMFANGPGSGGAGGEAAGAVMRVVQYRNRRGRTLSQTFL